MILHGLLPIVFSYLALTGDYLHSASDHSGVTDILLVIKHGEIRHYNSARYIDT